MRTKIIFILSLLLFSVYSSDAQNNTSSPYSIRAYGEIENFSTAYSRSLGGSINGIRSPRCVSFSNPASLGAISNVLLDFGFRLDYSKVYSETAINNGYNGNFNYFSLSFPVYRKPVIKKDTSVKQKTTRLYTEYQTIWSTSFGITPYSSINASYSKLYDTTYGKIGNYYSRSGGLSRAFFMNSVNVTKNLTLGLNTEFIFGQSKSNEGYFLFDSGVTRATTHETNARMNGFKFNFGIQGVRNSDTISRVDSILDNGRMIQRIRKYPIRFVYGGTINNAAQLNYTVFRQVLNKSNYFLSSAIDTVLLEENKKGKTGLPLGYSLGFGVTFNNLYMITADYRSETWGDIKSTLFSDSFTNSSQISIGFAYRPDMDVEMLKRKENNKGLKANLEYRLGFRMLNTGYNFKDNKGIISPLKEYGISFGIGIPKTRVEWDTKQVVLKSMFNLTGEYIFRGSIENGMPAERLYRLTLGFTLSDIWFKQRKFY